MRYLCGGFKIYFRYKINKMTANKQVKSEESRILGLQDYYAGLSKKERGGLLRYLIATYGYSYSSLAVKFSKRMDQRFNLRDLALIEPVIESAEWRG